MIVRCCFPCEDPDAKSSYNCVSEGNANTVYRVHPLILTSDDLDPEALFRRITVLRLRSWKLHCEHWKWYPNGTDATHDFKVMFKLGAVYE